MRTRLTILDGNEVKTIHGAALRILERTGAVIDNAHAVDLLRHAGARTDGTGRVHLPSHVVEDALARAPQTVAICDRLGQVAMVLGGPDSYFGAHANCPFTVESLTGVQREMTLADLEVSARVIDALPHVDYITVTDTVGGVVPEYADVAGFVATTSNSRKPMSFDLLSLETGRMICEIGAAVAGGQEALRARPFFIIGDSPVSPLYHPAEPVAKIMFAARLGLPCLYNPMPQGGLTAPTTPAAVVALTWAEILTGLVISQLVNPGTPFICGGVPSIFDVRNLTFVYGSPELFLMCSALTDIVRAHRLPSFGTAGMTNAKALDLQAATDVALSTLMAMLSGSNLVHDVGIINVGAHSLPLVVLADEVIGMVRHIEKGIEITEETLALDLVDAVGPKGNFISEEHTVAHFRQCWYPATFDHTPAHGDRVDGRIESKLQGRIDGLLARHRPPELPDAARELIASYAHFWTCKGEQAK
jgi:trimethylamine--corrinoid protein Co-methyltransferase